MAQKQPSVEDSLKHLETTLASLENIFTQNAWLARTAQENRLVNSNVVIPPALLERLASRERMMALAKVVDSTAELESDAADVSAFC